MTGSSAGGGRTHAGRPLAHAALLDALEDVLAVSPTGLAGAPGRGSLCRMLARLVTAMAAGHVRFHPATRTAQLTIWHDRLPATTSTVPEPDVADAAHDWWLTSRTRRVLLEALDQRYLAELALDPDPAGPSVLVVGRSLPFTEADSALMAAEHRALRVVERVLDRLSAGATDTAGSGLAGSGPARLTAREQEVLEMLSQGLLARSIAQRLEVSERTVHKHLANVYRKLDAHDRLLAVRRAETLGLLPAPRAARW